MPYTHNHTYTHKTSKGHNLSIKNNKVYIDGKLANTGYTWYDKNNGNTYGVNPDGTYKLLKTEEKTRQYLEDYQKYNREDYKEDYKSTIEAIGEENLTGRDLLYKYRNEFVDKRYDSERPYGIPQHLPGVKRRTLSSGNYKGIKVYDNTLDSIRVNAKRNNIPFNVLLGIAAETSLGRDYPATMNETKEDYNSVRKNPFYIQQFLQGDYLYPTDLLNNHNYFVDNNATGTINTLIDKGVIPGTKSWKNGQPFPIIGGTLNPYTGKYSFITLTDKQNDIINEEAKKVLKSKETSSNNPWTNAVDFYKNFNYGMGPSYSNTVKQRGNSIINTKEIQSYLRRSLEKGGK